MVILETFFLKEKEKIQISDLDKSLDILENDFSYFEKENNKIN